MATSMGYFSCVGDDSKEVETALRKHGRLISS